MSVSSIGLPNSLDSSLKFVFLRIKPTKEDQVFSQDIAGFEKQKALQLDFAIF